MLSSNRSAARPYFVFGSLALLTMTTIVVAALSILRTSQVDNSPSTVRPVDAAATSLPSRSTLLIVGDSYAGGVDPTIPTYAPGLAEEMGWNLALDAQGGTGFLTYRVTPETTTAPFIERLSRDKEQYTPDHILIDGGRNDLDRPLDELLPAMRTYLTEVRRAWPQATITVVVPSYITPEPAPDYPAIKDELNSVAAQIDATVIDPVAEGWYRDVDPEWLWTDKVHPSAAGGRYIGQRLADDLRALGLGEPRP